MSAVGLFDTLGAIPALPGALCKGRADIFDAPDNDRFTEAVALCRGCPALTQCRAWADTQMDNELSGVVAGVDRAWASRPSLRRPPRTAP